MYMYSTLKMKAIVKVAATFVNLLPRCLFCYHITMLLIYIRQVEMYL